MGNIDKKTGSRGATWLVSIAAVPLIAIGVYYAFLAAVPVCGPPRNSLLGQIYWYVPLAILVAEAAVLRGVGLNQGRRPAWIASSILLVAVITLAGDLVIFLAFFVAGNCGE
jgi:hypothetical protein